VETLIRAAALEGDATLFMDLAPGPAMSVGDVIQVQQVVLNLVRNAIDAMRTLPKPERRLVVRSLHDRDMIVVSVEDAGPPLEKEALDHLFAPFYTTKANGLGMGLSISRSIIEAHGGAIEARSRSGRGLAVRFTLRASEEAGRRRRSPDERMKARSDRHRPARPLGQGLPGRRRGVRRRALTRLLRAAGLEVASYASAEALLAELSPAEKGPACVVADLQMPGLTGLGCRTSSPAAASGCPFSSSPATATSPAPCAR
jgi:hypothetical protein